MTYWTLRNWLIILGVTLLHSAMAQKMASQSLSTTSLPQNFSIAGTKIDYYKSDQEAFTQILAPVVINQRDANGRLAAPKSEFVVTYASNFPVEARKAFQYAVDIWSMLITSSVPIRIQANWVIDKPNILGSTGPTSYRYNFDGGQKARAFYPVALAEKIARRQLNDPNDADIVADINRNNGWYFGIDGKPPTGQTDMVTVILHEIAHGLGFIGFFDVDFSKNDMGEGKYLAGLPSVYDCFIENVDGKRLVNGRNEYPNNSVSLHQQLTSSNLFLNGTMVVQATGQKPRLSARPVFNRATSIYHLAEETYPPGNPNSLMTPELALSEVNHSPGPLLLNFLSDLEWKTTSLLHTPNLSTEDLKDIVFSVRIFSDTTLTSAPPRLFYRKTKPTETDTVATSAVLTRVGTTNEYRFTLPSMSAQGDTWYYLQVQDASGRSFSNPGTLTDGQHSWHYMRVAPDNVPPTILYSPAKNAILSTTVADSLPIRARIFDDRGGIQAAYVEYQINGVAQPNVPLRATLQTINTSAFEELYLERLNFSANSLKAGDKITYRIVAVDSAKAKNQAVNPSTGYYQLSVVNTFASREQYSNTFTDPASANDFVGRGFSVATPTGFIDPAIHSDHPYANGSDFRLESNLDYTLLVLIRVKTNPDSTMIRYDEIVLVEPATTGSRFGDAGFYDYVVVEGSKDNGKTWYPITDGYNSLERPEWQAAYSFSLVAGALGEKNSETMGAPALYRHRDIPILKSGGVFQPGDQVLIRFRLFSDQLAHGWGWAIDNLRIQLPPEPTPLANEPLSAQFFAVSPNPTTEGILRIEADLRKPATTVQIHLISSTGRRVLTQDVAANGKRIKQEVDVHALPIGLYFVQLSSHDEVLTKKVMIMP